MEMVNKVVVTALGRYFNCWSDKIMLTLEADFVRLPANLLFLDLSGVECHGLRSHKGL